MKKISNHLAVAVLLAVASMAANATTYNFSFPAYAGSGTSTSGWFNADVVTTSWTQATSFNGTVSTTNGYGTSGAISNLYVRNIAVGEWALSFNNATTYYTFNMTADPQKRNTNFYLADSGYFTGKNGVQTFGAALSPSSYVTAASVPEIDGNKLPQVMLLIGGMVVAARMRRSAHKAEAE